MPERGYQLRSSGVLTFTRTSVRGCEGEASEVVLSGKWVVSHHLHVVTPTLPLQNLGVRFARGNHALREALALSDEINRGSSTVIKILILFLERSERFMGVCPKFRPSLR